MRTRKGEFFGKEAAIFRHRNPAAREKAAVVAGGRKTAESREAVSRAPRGGTGDNGVGNTVGYGPAIHTFDRRGTRKGANPLTAARVPWMRARPPKGMA